MRKAKLGKVAMNGHLWCEPWLHLLERRKEVLQLFQPPRADSWGPGLKTKGKARSSNQNLEIKKTCSHSELVIVNFSLPFQGSQSAFALDEDLVLSMLRHLDDHKFRATMACVCKTWQACVRRSWNRVHFCFRDVGTLQARLSWLERQVLDHSLQLQSLELHFGTATAHTCRCWQC